MAGIKIATGIKTYDIEDDNGNVRGQIHINPSDNNLYPRVMEVADKVQDILKLLDDANDDNANRIITEIDAQIKAEINRAFDDDNLSSVVFGNQHCLNTLNGVSYVERFFNAILPIVQKDIADEQKKSDKRVSKYTSQVK